MLNHYEWTSWLSLHPDEMKLAQILDQILDAMNENMDDLPWLRTIKWNHFIILLDSLNYRITQSNLSLSLRGLQMLIYHWNKEGWPAPNEYQTLWPITYGVYGYLPNVFPRDVFLRIEARWSNAIWVMYFKSLFCTLERWCKRRLQFRAKMFSTKNWPNFGFHVG